MPSKLNQALGPWWIRKAIYLVSAAVIVILVATGRITVDVAEQWLGKIDGYIMALPLILAGLKTTADSDTPTPVPAAPVVVDQSGRVDINIPGLPGFSVFHDG